MRSDTKSVELNRKEQLRTALSVARSKTLWLLDQVPDDFLRRRVHSFYSPIGWHFGHVGRTEEYWVIHKALGRPVLDEQLSFLFADLPDNPKDNRVNIPDRAGAIDYLRRTREQVLFALDECDLEQDDAYLLDGYAWEFALQHECQHQETITEMLQLIQKQVPAINVELPPWKSHLVSTMIDVPGGCYVMGSDDRHGYDNEKSKHPVPVEPFRLSEHPVTAFQWTQFLEDGGYQRPELWTAAGWAWRESEGAVAPEYWIRQSDGWAILAPLGPRAIHPDEPASCLSWFEADAFARWSGKRLPTEEEWEYAATFDLDLGEARRYPWGSEPATPSRASYGLNSWSPSPVGTHTLGASALGFKDMAGGIWEWTSSKFLPYPGFRAFPYDGYSKEHMLGAHHVCRGGSWATAAPILRCSFRNWYVPTYRQGLLGMRLAESLPVTESSPASPFGV
jgi:iron(II)-dependent oxidoreductase